MTPTVAVPADWLVPGWRTENVGALMTTRAGGVGAAPFDGFNVRDAVGDDPHAVAQHRRALADMIGATPVWLDQVHGATVVRLNPADAAPGAPMHRADASVTTVPGVACVVQVADCLPVLFAAPAGRAVGAAHAGWRGLASGVLEATLRSVCAAADCRPGEVQAWLGACIGPQQFEVGADVLQAFGMAAHERPKDAALRRPSPAGIKESGKATYPCDTFGNDGHDALGAGPPSAPQRFVLRSNGKWLADLPGLARDRLLRAGVGGVGGGAWCTVSQPSRFFSFRRDRVTGRMAALIWIGADARAG